MNARPTAKVKLYPKNILQASCRPRWGGRGGFRRAAVGCLLCLSGLGSATPSERAEPPAPSTPREFFNAGYENLRQGKLREAEAFLQSVLAAQNEKLQPPALYDLGHVRFAQGNEELKKGPAARP